MRFANIMTADGAAVCCVDAQGGLTGRLASDPAYPGDLLNLIQTDALTAAAAVLRAGDRFDAEAISWLPPIPNAGKVICVGLNYLDHAKETGHAPPNYPTLFGRFNSSLIGHAAPAIRPKLSEALDFEAEMVAVIGKGGRAIPVETALDHVIGYSVFNDISVRDYQQKSTQWTIGKNFDGTGVFGPTLVTADELPKGGRGLHIETRLNGVVVQSASTDDMIFDVATLIAIISAAMTLSPGDVIVTGTPSGVGMARKPPLWMKAGDICEVELQQVGLLRNIIADE
jgi:acylpyruvate hydrolase